MINPYRHGDPIRESANPYSEKEVDQSLSQEREKLSFADKMKAEREKIVKLIESGEIALGKEGLGQEVDKLSDFVLKNSKNELRKLSLEQVEELKKKFDLPYDSEVILIAAQELYKSRKIH
jgi:hypothetical protein